MKRLAGLAAALLLLGVAKTPVSISVHVARTSLDLLDVLAIQIAAHNPSEKAASVEFPAPAEYAVEVLQGERVVYTSTPANAPSAATVAHARALAPGPTMLATYEWNELASDGSSPSPGTYTVRVRLLDAGSRPVATTPVTFVDPVPVSAIAKLKVGDEITIAGRLDAALESLADSTGTIRLSRRLLGAPDAPVAVRGNILAKPDGSRELDVVRWAPLHASTNEVRTK